MAVFFIAMMIFVVTLFLKMPIAISIGVSSLSALWMSDISPAYMAQICFTGLDSFTYLAIPMFILAGFLMEAGGISKRIVDFAMSFVGNITGGLGIVNVLACMFFAAISGSSPATVAAIGSMMIPSMVEKGYDKDFSGALTATAGSLGILIPPSIPMIIYAVTAEISIGDMFLAGFAPGALVGGALIITVYIIAKKRNYKGSGQKFSVNNCFKTFWSAKWALLVPIIILGGIYSGKFTATEAACIAVIYALIIGLFVHKELKFNQLVDVVYKAAITTGSVIIILGFATVLSRWLTMAQIPREISELILSYTDSRLMILLIFVVMIMITGMFMETAAQILIYTPLFLPILVQLGVSPFHFGIILIIGTELALVTPPVGVNLFVARSITNTTMVKLSRAVAPFLVALFTVQVFLVFVPEIVLFVPEYFKKKPAGEVQIEAPHIPEAVQHKVYKESDLGEGT
ncbi:MAG: TRAP transporter large permease [Lentisphaeraceae bacterium]|nr:TRAP transporter large permease [Lentisphaeraceae bacterium]